MQERFEKGLDLIDRAGRKNMFAEIELNQRAITEISPNAPENITPESENMCLERLEK